MKNIDKLIASMTKQMSQEAKISFEGGYIQERTKYSRSGMKDLTARLSSGENSLKSYFKQIAETYQSIGLDIDFEYNPQTNTVALKVWNPDDLTEGKITDKEIPRLTIALDKKGITGSTVNKYAGYMGANGEFEVYTLMEKQAHDFLNILKRGIAKGRITQDTSAKDMQGIIRWAQRQITQLSPHASREAQNDLETGNKISSVTQTNVSRALEVYIGGYIDSLIANNKLYKISQEYDISGMLYTAFNLITNARTPQELESILKVFESDSRYKVLTSTPGWKNIKRQISNIRDTGFKTVAGTVNETARQRRVVGTSDARDISPADTVMSSTVRQQGLTTVRHSRSVYGKTGLATKLGESMGIQYNQEDSFDRTVNSLNISDDIAAKAWKKFTSTPQGAKYANRTMPSVREGGAIISEALARDLGTATRDYEKTIDNVEYIKMYDSAFKALKKKLKISEEDLFVPEKVAELGRKANIAVYKRLLAQNNRRTKGSQLTDVVQNDDGTWTFKGTEHIGYHQGQRLTDTYGNMRSASQSLPPEFFDAVFDILESDYGMKFDAEQRKSFHVIKEQNKEPNIRNIGAAIKESLTFITKNALARGMTASQIKEILPKEIADFLTVSSDGSYLYTDEMDQMLKSAEGDKGKAELLKRILLGIDKAKIKVGGYRSYNDKGFLIAPSMSANNISVPDAYDYGYYDARGAVTMGTGLPSVYRAAANSTAMGTISQKEAEAFNAYYKRKLGPQERKVQELEKKRKQQEKAAELTKESVEEDFKVDDKTTVSVGYGDQYDINLADTTIEPADYDTRGRIKNYGATVWGRIDQIRAKKAEEAKVNLEDVIAYIDGLDFSSTSQRYGDIENISGKKLFIPSYVYDEKGADYFRKDLGAVMGSLKFGNDEAANENALKAVARMQDDLYYKEGSQYREVYREKTKGSLYNKILGANLSQIMSEEEYAASEDKMAKFTSDVASAGVLLSKEDAKSILIDASQKEIKSLYRQLYGAGADKKTLASLGQQVDQAYKQGKELDIINQIIEALTVGTDANRNYLENASNPLQGLRGLVGRLPFMNGLDLKTLNSIFVEGGLERGSMRVGAGLARQVNADYDGDRIAIAMEQSMSPALKKIFDKIAEDQTAIAKRMALREKAENEKMVGYAEIGLGGEGKKTLYASAADLYAGIIGKTTKDDVGRLSNYSKSIRNKLANEQLDENALLSNPDSLANQKKAAAGMITRALFESIEQDAISSKKVINRILTMGASNNGKKLEEMTADEQGELYLQSLTELDKIIQDFSEGNVEFSKLISSLQKIGVLGEDTDEDSLMSGRVVEQVLETIARFSKGNQVFSWLFGKGVNKESILEKGGISLGALETAMARIAPQGINVLLNTARNKKGVNDEAISAETGGPHRYRQSRKVSVKEGEVDLSAIANIDKSTKAYQQYEKAIKEAGKALIWETELEQKKAAVALKEGKVIGTNVNNYGLLTTSLVNTAQAYQYVTERSQAITQSRGVGWTGPYGHIQGVMSKILESDDFNRQEWLRMSARDRSKRFQYDSVEGYEKDRNAVKGTLRGKHTHALNEAIAKASQLGVNVGSYEELRLAAQQTNAPNGLQSILNDYYKNLQAHDNSLAVLGFNREERVAEIEDARSRSERSMKELRHQMENVDGTIVGTERGVKIVDPMGTKLQGRTDLDYIGERTAPWDENQKLKDYYIVDYKTQEGKLTDSEIVQMLTYRGMKQKQQEAIRQAYQEKGEEGVREWAKKNKADKNQTDEEAFRDAMELKDISTFRNQVIGVGKEGEAIAYNIGAVGNDIISAILAGVTLTKDQIFAIREAVTATVKSTEGEKTVTGSEALWMQEQENSLKEYLNLLNQEKSILKEIHKVKQEIEIAEKKDESTDNLKEQLKSLEGIKRTIGKDKKKIEKEGEFGEKEWARIGEVQRINRRQISNDNKKFDADFLVKQKESSANEYEQLLKKRLSSEKQIFAAQQTIRTSYSNTEKKAMQEVITMTDEQIKLIDEKIIRLKQSGLLTSEQVKDIEQEYKVQQQLNKAQAGKAQHGGRSIWDMLKYDMQRATMRMFDFSIVNRTINSVQRGFQKIIQLTKELNQALTNIRIVTGYNEQQARSLMVTYQKLGKELGATTQEVANSANEWLRQGYSAQEAGSLIESSMKLSKLGMIDSSQATQYLTSALKGFKLEASDAISVVDKLTKVDMKAAISAGDIASALSRTATSAQIAGLSMDEAIGMVSTITEITQKSADSVGESLKTLLSRYGNVKAGVFSSMGLDDDGETTENINDIEKVLSKLGIRIRNTNLEMRDISSVLDELGEKWVTLDTVSKNAVATAFAGTRQREYNAPLIW